MARGGGPSVCVIGAGAVGLCSALELAQRGAGAVTVLEARHFAAGSSGVSVGIVESQYLDPLDIELRVHSLRSFAELEREHGLRIVRNGYLRLAHDSLSHEAFARSVELQHELGVLDARLLEREQVAALVPDLATDDLSAALFGPSDGYLDGHLYCGLLAELAHSAGVELLSGVELLGAEPRGREQSLLRTSAGELICDVVVNAAGAWGGKVAHALGRELSLVPQRQQAALVHLPRTLAYTMPSVMDYTPGSDTLGLYFRDDGDGRLIAGLHSEEAHAEPADPDAFAHQADAEFLEALAAALARRLPSLQDARLSGGWAGLYPVSGSGRPLVGPLPGDGARSIVVGGAGGSGIQLSPILGRLAADWVLDGRASSLPSASTLAPAAD